MATAKAAGAPSLALATGALIVLCLALGGVSALESRHMSVTHGTPLAWSTLFATTMPRWLLLAFTLPVVLRLATQPPLRSRLKTALLHLALFGVISLAHAATIAWSMEISSPMVVFAFPYEARLLRSWYGGLPMVVALYGGVLAAAWALSEARERARRTVRASQLEAQLQSARIAVLRARLQPHFLYNTLHGIAALVADMQPREAVRAIEHLSDLLHASLRDDEREEIPIAEEIGLAERYLALQQMRFGERLRYDVRVEPAVAHCLVPVLMLQPVVENAVVHGLESGQQRLHISLVVREVDEGVELQVENDGPGLERSARNEGFGLGLAATRARLMTAYGDRASLRMLPGAEAGVCVRIIVPRLHSPMPVGTP